MSIIALATGIGIIALAIGYPINVATRIITNIIKNPYLSKLVESDHPDEPATATYGIAGGAADPVEAISPITAVIAAAFSTPLDASATGTASVGTN